MKKILFALVILNLVMTPMAFAADTPIQSSDSMSTDFKFDLRPITNAEIDTTNFTNQGLNYIFNKAVAIMAGTIGTAAVLAIVYGGFQIITAMGHEDEMNAGKAMIEKAIKALVFVLGAYVIVTAVQFLIKSIYG